MSSVAGVVDFAQSRCHVWTGVTISRFVGAAGNAAVSKGFEGTAKAKSQSDLVTVVGDGSGAECRAGKGAVANGRNGGRV